MLPPPAKKAHQCLPDVPFSPSAPRNEPDLGRGLQPDWPRRAAAMSESRDTPTPGIEPSQEYRVRVQFTPGQGEGALLHEETVDLGQWSAERAAKVLIERAANASSSSAADGKLCARVYVLGGTVVSSSRG
jgi:hypothetical protein